MAQVRRIRRRTAAAPSELAGNIEILMKSIANATDAMAALKVKIDTETATLCELMAKAREDKHEYGDLVAERFKPSGRSSTVIDPRKFYNTVEEDDFFDSVTVSVTKAKGILSERALAKISNTIPGTPGAETVKIKRIKLRG